VSVGLVLDGVKEVLMGAFSKNEDWIDLMPEGRPPAAAGPWFIGITEGGSYQADANDVLAELFRVEIVISIRTAKLPRDRRGMIYRHMLGAFEPLERLIMGAMTPWAASFIAANAAGGLGTTDTGSVIFGPLLWTGTSPAVGKGPEWALGDIASIRGADTEVWAVRSLNYQGALRVQPFDAVK